MATLESFIKSNESLLGFLRWIIIPILLAAALWVLDARYLSRGDWEKGSAAQSAIIVQLGNDQKVSFTKLTDAITSLAVEQRNSAELQRISNISITNMVGRLDKHEASDTVKWDRQETTVIKFDSRLDALETSTAKNNEIVSRNTNILMKLQDIALKAKE